MRASARERLGDARQRLPTVNQHVERAPRARRRIAGSPQRRAARRLQLIDPANTTQPKTMMSTVRGLDAVTRPPINALDQATRHPQSLPCRPTAKARGQPSSDRYWTLDDSTSVRVRPRQPGQCSTVSQRDPARYSSHTEGNLRQHETERPSWIESFVTILLVSQRSGRVRFATLGGECGSWVGVGLRSPRSCAPTRARRHSRRGLLPPAPI
jgi:hypothetical protein